MLWHPCSAHWACCPLTWASGSLYFLHLLGCSVLSCYLSVSFSIWLSLNGWPSLSICLSLIWLSVSLSECLSTHLSVYSSLFVSL